MIMNKKQQQQKKTIISNTYTIFEETLSNTFYKETSKFKFHNVKYRQKKLYREQLSFIYFVPST